MDSKFTSPVDVWILDSNYNEEINNGSRPNGEVQIRIHSHIYRCPSPDRCPPPSSSTSWHTEIGEIDDIFVSKMHGFEVRSGGHHYATTSCLAHAHCATIGMNTVCQYREYDVIRPKGENIA